VREYLSSLDATSNDVCAAYHACSRMHGHCPAKWAVLAFWAGDDIIPTPIQRR
jgi:hypothetical protein